MTRNHGTKREGGENVDEEKIILEYEVKLNFLLTDP